MTTEKSTVTEMIEVTEKPQGLQLEKYVIDFLGVFSRYNKEGKGYDKYFESEDFKSLSDEKKEYANEVYKSLINGKYIEMLYVEQREQEERQGVLEEQLVVLKEQGKSVVKFTQTQEFANLPQKEQQVLTDLINEIFPLLEQEGILTAQETERFSNLEVKEIQAYSEVFTGVKKFIDKTKAKEKNLEETQTQTQNLLKKGLSMLNSEHNVLKILNGVNGIPGATKDFAGNYRHQLKEDSFKIMGTDTQTAKELIENYGNEIHKDLLYFLLKATATSSAEFTFNNDEYFNTMGITKQTKNKDAFLKRLQTLAQTEYTAYYNDAGKKTFTTAPIVTYSKTGTWANKKDGTKELYWTDTQIQMKWLKDIVSSTRNTASLCLIENDIFTKTIGKNSKNNFIPLYIDLEKLYRSNLKKLKENFHRVSVSHIIETLHIEENQVVKNGFTVAIKDPLDKFLDNFFEWHYGETIHEKRLDFENDYIIYRPKKHKTKLEYYPKADGGTVKTKRRAKKEKQKINQ
jgi:hypothetical protein